MLQGRQGECCLSKSNSDAAAPPFRLSRRNLLTGALGAAVMHRIGRAQSKQSAGSWMLLGTQNGQGVYRARWDTATGKMTEPELAVATPRPTYLALHSQLPVLYACNEREGDAAGVSAFRMERQGAVLTPLSHQPVHGDDPCYVSADRTGKLLFTANYGGGSLSVFPLDAMGAPGTMKSQFACATSGLCGSLGPVHDRQDAPHLHCATLSPDNRSLLACDLADDGILIFPVNLAGGEPLGQAIRVPARPGSGPRHIAFHPDGRLFYCVHELDCTVDAYLWSGSGAGTRPVENSLLQLAAPSEHPATPNTGAELAVSRDGRFLYASTRGIDQLTVASIDPADHAKLRMVQQLSCGGAKPRFFALDPTERWLLCANQDGSTVTIFARDAHTGQLTPHGSQAAPSPMCIVWL